MPKKMLSLLLLIGLLVPFVYNWSPQEIIPMGPSTPPKSLTKTYLVNTRTVNYDEQGILTQIMEADRAEQYAKQKLSSLIQPRMYSHIGEDQSWSVRSDAGLYFPRRNIVALGGGVTFVNDQGQLQLNTESMKINLKKQTAESKVAVIITQGLATTTASGMTADLKKEIIRMKSNVESIYVPAAP
jgi:LPS export ABC transporter protein LptC